MVAESSTETSQHHLSLDLVILLFKCTILILRGECKCSYKIKLVKLCNARLTAV